MNAMPAVALPSGSGVRPRPLGAPSTPSTLSTPSTPSAPLRLTRRGRVVASAVAALLVTVIFLLAAAAAQATSHAPSPQAARQNLVQMVVRPGQSLWSVAENADPDQDTRAVIQQIIDLNALNSDVVVAGQQLWVPRG